MKEKRLRVVVAALIPAALFIASCGSGGGETRDAAGDAAGDAADARDGDGNADAADTAADPAGEETAPPWGARVHGTVWGPHPDGADPLFPVSGAMVAAYSSAPDDLPVSVYCEPCVQLPAEVPNTLSSPDGSFVLELRPGARYFLAVQKGQFRRVRAYDAPAAPGDYALDEELTTLPRRRDAAAGDTIPSVAVVYGDYDHIEDLFAKVGMGEDDGAYGYKYDQADSPLVMYDNGDEEHHGLPLARLIGSVDEMRLYHIILFNCSYNAIFRFMGDADVQQRLRTWVSEGGKLYVSDYAMPVVEKTWHEFVWFTDPLHGGCNEADTNPPSCNHGPPFDAPSRAADDGLRAWLDAQGLLGDGFETKENWDTIGGLFEGDMGRDPETGDPVRALPYVWVEGSWNYDAEDLAGAGIDPAEWDFAAQHPFTVSWQYGCGRVLFTTYHTVGTTRGGRHPGLYEQELALFYLIMQIGVCQEEPLLI